MVFRKKSTRNNFEFYAFSQFISLILIYIINWIQLSLFISIANDHHFSFPNFVFLRLTHNSVISMFIKMFSLWYLYITSSPTRCRSLTRFLEWKSTSVLFANWCWHMRLLTEIISKKNGCWFSFQKSSYTSASSWRWCYVKIT